MPARIDPSELSRSDVPTDLEVVFGSSVEGRPLTVTRRGDVDGVRVLVIGCIHGNEADGIAIVEHLMRMDSPDGVDLWLVPTINPDGTAADIRHNASGVDLNRNFPVNWAPLAEPGDWQYGGPAAASEPETAATVALGELVEPSLVLWYHQDLFRISPSRGLSGEVRARYAELTGLPLIEVTGGTYTGTASQWSRTVTADGGFGFTVELGPSLTDAEAERHAEAVVTVAAELLSG
jgi:protein MpaA